jgi:hypothetical protein
MAKLYAFEVTADPTWLARGFGDELGMYLEAKLKTRPNLSKVEASFLVQLVVRLLKDQVSVTGKVVAHPRWGLNGKKAAAEAAAAAAASATAAQQQQCSSSSSSSSSSNCYGLVLPSLSAPCVGARGCEGQLAGHDDVRDQVL